MKSLAKICLVLLAAVTMAAYSTQAQTDSTTTPATTNTAPAKPKVKSKAYAGTIASVDADAKTFTVTLTSGTTETLKVTSKTRIKKDGEPATLADAAAGLKVKGYMRKNDAGDMIATSVNIGETKPKAAATPPAPAAPADK